MTDDSRGHAHPDWGRADDGSNSDVRGYSPNPAWGDGGKAPSWLVRTQGRTLQDLVEESGIGATFDRSIVRDAAKRDGVDLADHSSAQDVFKPVRELAGLMLLQRQGYIGEEEVMGKADALVTRLSDPNHSVYLTEDEARAAVNKFMALFDNDVDRQQNLVTR